MAYNKIPKSIVVNNKKYVFNEWDVDEEGSPIDCWHVMIFEPEDNRDGDNMPPDYGGYYLCTAMPTREEAEKEMLNKLNHNW